ncbi:putative concanavalin A-like lectin/glucanase domain-containing protein [Rosa chinensis]|uniref:Putative concanavalin A-like lectin/glucanase domain-containing protein n=1 Tax=Rosa chinensis TaxID=74649 RepID=A0A2P6RS36_ROSCH|nr:putative concanavalin A-like lectin/glucanase domain-containing protein [Rosa chinensis]
MSVLNHIALVSTAFILLLTQWSSSWPVDPTLGFISLPLNTSNYHIHKPYDLPLSKRYSFKHGVHKMWVYFKDKPLSRIGYDYSSGVWQFEGYGYVPCGTANVTIMQVFGASPHATTLMLRVGSNGTLTYYRTVVLDPYIYDRWFRVNVIHDVYASHLKVYIDGVLKLEAPGRGGKFHYFKCGVYSQPDGLTTWSLVGKGSRC